MHIRLLLKDVLGDIPQNRIKLLVKELRLGGFPFCIRTKAFEFFLFGLDFYFLFFGLGLRYFSFSMICTLAYIYRSLIIKYEINIETI